jgi:penicillin-binding protein 2
MMIGNRRFACDNGLGHHGKLQLPAAIAESCDIYFWTVGLRTGVEAIAAEARRFHLDRPTGIELPGETHRMLVPDPAWKERAHSESWSQGDTANMSIGQGYLGETPLVMACFAASFARDEVWTKPSLLHDPNRPAQHTEKTGLSAVQRAAILKGMLGCTSAPEGTAYFPKIPNFWVSGVDIAGKTGTAQITRPQGKVDEAWFICFAPLENPEIASPSRSTAPRRKLRRRPGGLADRLGDPQEVFREEARRRRLELEAARLARPKTSDGRGQLGAGP